MYLLYEISVSKHGLKAVIDANVIQNLQGYLMVVLITCRPTKMEFKHIYYLARIEATVVMWSCVTHQGSQFWQQSNFDHLGSQSRIKREVQQQT